MSFSVGELVALDPSGIHVSPLELDIFAIASTESFVYGR